MSPTTDWIFSYLVSLAGSLPVFIVWLVGALICITRFWRHRKACLLTGLALLISMGTRLLYPLANHLLFNVLANQNWAPGNVSLETRVQIINLISSLVYSVSGAISWGLVLWVIFGPGGYTIHPPRSGNEGVAANRPPASTPAPQHPQSV